MNKVLLGCCFFNIVIVICFLSRDSSYVIASILLNGKWVCMLMQVRAYVLETIHGIISVVVALITYRRSDTLI